MENNKRKIALLSLAVGFWLMTIPLTFEFKSVALLCSDMISGILLIVLGLLFLVQGRSWPGWGIGGIGVWLQLAPLIFWAPTELNYLNDTLVGVILIAFSLSLTTSRFSESDTGSCLPEGWSYNPSSWVPRLMTVGLALLCWTFSRYLAVYQLGYIDQMWDPVFHNGSLRVITSQISRDFPVSDAGLGAFGYTLEFLLGWHGGARRWHTMPWLVLTFGILVVPVGLTSIILIILQPIVVGAWCFWCLATAACMLIMILLSGSELVATFLFLRKAVREGHSFWEVLWKGRKVEEMGAVTKPRCRKKNAMAWGFSACWNLVVIALLGAYLMLIPYRLAISGPLATAAYMIGPFMVTFAIVAMVEVYRVIRFMNLILGLAILLTTLFVAVNWEVILIGLLAIGLSLSKGIIRERYGIWERHIF